MTQPPKVAAIHDLSGLGRCSLTAAIPILSVMGIQCCPLPTAVLSGQTGFDSYSCLDFTPHMRAYVNEWEKEHIEFQAIYTGFLGSIGQVDIVRDFIKRFSKSETLVAVDPVMGDGGKLYDSMPKDICTLMRELAAAADIVFPNLTEAALLTGHKACCFDPGDCEIEKLARAVSQLGPSKVVITGVVQGSIIRNFAYDFKEESRSVTHYFYNGKSYSGTGDIFASVVLGSLLQGDTLESAVRKAGNFIGKCVTYSDRFDTDVRNGIIFEPFLRELG